VLFLYLGLATSVYLLMPPDWMGEYRFATAFFVFLYWSLGVVVSGLLRVSSPGPFPRKVAFALSAAIVVMSALLHTGRSIAFAADPVVPFERVAAFSGTGYNRLAAILGREDTSLLTPDMGGTLYYSTLRVYDLAGLCDRTIARSLKTDREAFLRYVFEEARPTFITCTRAGRSGPTSRRTRACGATTPSSVSGTTARRSGGRPRCRTSPGRLTT
jgi:hypothetical protein